MGSTSRNSALRRVLILIKRFLLTVNWLFAPKMFLELMMRHMILFMMILGTAPIIHCTIKPLLKFIKYHICLRIARGSAWVNKYSQIQRRYEQSGTYNEYEKYGLELDKLKGHDSWRDTTTSSLYSYQTIQSDLFELQGLLAESNDANKIRLFMRFMHSRIGRNYCGITNHQLYSISHIHTKKCIEAFIDKMCESLRFIARTHCISLEEKFQFFESIRHALGRTALCLSGGGYLTCAHIGTIVTLARRNLLPKVISGSSGGSYLAAMLCTTEYNQVEDLERRLIKGCLVMLFYRESDADTWRKLVFVSLARYWETKYLLDITVVRDITKAQLGDITFLEAYHKTGRILNISVTGCDSHPSQVLNYVTAPNVTIWSAVTASGCIPNVFQPQELYVKSPETGAISADTRVKFCDGSLTNDLVMKKMTQFNVNNHVVSQVDFHVVSFLFHTMASPIPLFSRLLNFFGKQFHHYLSTIEHAPIKIPHLNGLLTQPITGDVTVVPHVPVTDFLGILKNDTSPGRPMYIKRLSSSASKATFKNISRLHALCAVEFTIDECLDTLKSSLQKGIRNRRTGIGQRTFLPS
eukprot:314029_1